MNTAHSAIEKGDGKSRGKALDVTIPGSEGEDSEDRCYHERSRKRLRRSATTSMERHQCLGTCDDSGGNGMELCDEFIETALTMHVEYCCVIRPRRKARKHQRII